MWKSSFIIAVAVFVAACGRIPTAPQDSDHPDAVVQRASEVDDSKGGKEYESSFHCQQEPVEAEAEESAVQQTTRIDDSKGGKEYQVSFQCNDNAVDGSITR